MGKLNIVKSKFDGKLGQFVGSDWKGIPTIRAYATGVDPQTKPQLSQRAFFKELQSYCSFIAPKVKPYTHLDCSRQYLQNALVSHNKSKRNDDNSVQFIQLQFCKSSTDYLSSVSVSKSGTTFNVRLNAKTTNFDQSRFQTVCLITVKKDKFATVKVLPGLATQFQFTRQEITQSFGYCYCWLFETSGRYRKASNTVGFYFS